MTRYRLIQFVNKNQYISSGLVYYNYDGGDAVVMVMVMGLCP